ncbi:response regulator [Adhaeribacter arboris]|uniref:Response regulator n=1 Tax=Adhaeribacter arboris TaxID=2072846 RepID=A0A2T2YDD1_9BACT|nr:response regulator [Adhaeribacter arboris]PSR53512.1 response regulator [Adhaeribacter arboris]
MHSLHKILIVDDDSVTRYLISRVIKQAGISQQILQAGNGEEALQVLYQACSVQACPNLIFLDINMPLMDGFEFLSALQKSTLADSSFKIVILTTSQNPKDVEKAKQYPITAYLEKPFTADQLNRIIAA